MAKSFEPGSTFNKRPLRSDHFKLCKCKCVGRKQHILSETLQVQILLSKIISFGSIAITLVKFNGNLLPFLPPLRNGAEKEFFRSSQTNPIDLALTLL